MLTVRGWGKVKKGSINLEKYRPAQSSLCTIIVNRKEINEPQAISNALHDFYRTLFKVNCLKNLYKVFLTVSLPKLPI